MKCTLQFLRSAILVLKAMVVAVGNAEPRIGRFYS